MSSSSTNTPEVHESHDGGRRERQALCCECGNLRTFKDGYAPRRWIGEGGRGNERHTCDFKCKPCGKVTRHAIVNNGRPGGECAAEADNFGMELVCTRDGDQWVWRYRARTPQAPASEVEDEPTAALGWDLVEAFGVEVVPVEGLRDKVVLVQSQDVVLIRHDLDDEDREWAVAWLVKALAKEMGR